MDNPFKREDISKLSLNRYAALSRRQPYHDNKAMSQPLYFSPLKLYTHMESFASKDSRVGNFKGSIPFADILKHHKIMQG